jgi:carbamoyltransferase
MWILGLAGSHNSAAALIKDGRVVVAVQTERITRRKRDPIRIDRLGPDALQVIRYCLEYAGIDLPDLAAFATCTPWAVSPPNFLISGERPLSSLSLPQFISVPHHLAHAEYSLHYSAAKHSLVLVCDGAGSYESDRPTIDIKERERNAIRWTQATGKESISAYLFDGKDVELVYKVAYGEEFCGSMAGGSEGQPRWMASLGHIWEWAAFYCHGDRHEAGKVMGLAPYGDPSAFADLEIVSLEADGRPRFDIRKLIETFESPNVNGADVTGLPHYADVAAHVQASTNRFLEQLIRFLLRRYPADVVAYSGGVALNSVANSFLEKRIGIRLHMNGSCEDNGTAIGSALAVHHVLTGQRVTEAVTDFYGREYPTDAIDDALRDVDARVTRLSRDELLSAASDHLCAGKVVGWFQGRGEFGPRALGNRSLLMDARNPRAQEILNGRIKHREAFRPYAPAVTLERAAEFFEIDGPSPVMLRVVPVKAACLPSVTHVDGTARVQTVTRAENALFHDLLKAFEARTGIPVLLNTSFNVSGEPIVESPRDAVRAFERSEIDSLFIGDTMVLRR